MGLRSLAFDDLAEAAPLLRRVGVRSLTYAEDGSVARIEFYPENERRLHDTEGAPPPAPEDRESGIVPIEERDGDNAPPGTWDPHPEFIDGETACELVDREIQWLATNGRSQ